MNGQQEMAQVPEIVALRLRQAEAQSAHPDADRLAALVEQSLSPEKREATLLHLSACATCRDVVALMAIASPVSAPVEAVHGISNWSRFSPFRALPVRWAAVAAGVAVVMSTVWIGYEHKPANAPVQVAVVRPAPSRQQSGSRQNFCLASPDQQLVR